MHLRGSKLTHPYFFPHPRKQKWRKAEREDQIPLPLPCLPLQMQLVVLCQKSTPPLCLETEILERTQNFSYTVWTLPRRFL